NLPPGSPPILDSGRPEIVIDDQPLDGPLVQSDRSYTVHLLRRGETWEVGESGERLRKRHGLQGPIDDAFMDSFLFVRPTGKAAREAVDRWVASEMARAVEHWRRHFRGEVRVKDDTQVTDADMASSNLVLWGDPQSNAVLKRIADRLPIGWTS